MQESLRFLDAASAIVLATDSTLMPSTAAISAGVGGDRMSLRMPQGGGSGSSANSHGGRGTMGPGTVAGNRMSVQRGASPPLLSSATLAAAGASGGSSSHLPKWVAGSVEELERLCIEKQRGAAVALIEKVG